MPEPRDWGSDRLRQVLDQLTDAVVVVDRDFCFVHANAVALAMVGKTLDEIVGTNHWDLLPGLRNTVVWDEYHRALETGVPAQFEYRSARDGRWLQARAFPSAEGLVFHLTDVTVRRVAEEERDRREAIVQAMLDAMPQIAWAAEPDGRTTYFNARWYDYTGLTPDDPYRIADVVHPEDLERTLALRTEAYAVGTTYEAQLRIRRCDGVYRWHLTRAEPLRNPEGRVTGYVGTSTDVHEGRLLVEELRRAQRNLTLTADAVPVLIAFMEPDLRYGFVNRTFAAWHACPRERIVGRHARDFLGGPLYEAILPTMEATLAGERRTIERWVDYPDGHRRFVHADYLPRRADSGEVEGFYVLSTDLTERALQAEALERRVAERTADLQAAVEALQGFTYHVAHDLRAPLRAIVSTSHIVREDYSAALPQEAHALLARQSEAAGKLGRLIDDLLRMARLSHEPVVRERLDLSQIAGEVADHALAVHPDRAVRIEVEDGLRADADPRLLGLAVGNLVENAVKYSPSGGTVRVGRRSDGAFFVADEGIGIEPRYFERIFEPFQRLHRDEEFVGNGIGLSNVRQIVRRHGGRVWVESEPGRGSTFFFTLAEPPSFVGEGI